MGFQHARSRVIPDNRVIDTLGPLARYVHLDCTVSPIPTQAQVGVEIQALFEASAASRLAFGIYFVTNARGDAVYSIRPCRCRCLVDVSNGAGLLRARGRNDLAIDVGADLKAIEQSMVHFRAHTALRREVSEGRATAADLRTFVTQLSDRNRNAWPCRHVDRARASMLTVGCVSAGGGSPVGVGRVLDPGASTAPELRERLLAGMTDAALRTDPFPEQTVRHLALTYILLAQDEIAPAVESACIERGCTPEELPLHALPVPLAARERLALLVCGSREVAVSDGREALEILARH